MSGKRSSLDLGEVTVAKILRLCPAATSSSSSSSSSSLVVVYEAVEEACEKEEISKQVKDVVMKLIGEAIEEEESINITSK